MTGWTSMTALDVAAEVAFEAQRLFRVFREASPDAVVLMDASGQIVYANSGVDELFGYRRDELMGELFGLRKALVRRLVEMHHGTVTANRAGPGLGGEFVVRLTSSPTSP